MRLLARAIVWLRWPIALAWIGGAAVAFVALPSISEVRGGAVGALVPEDAPALEAERGALADFAFPALARAVIVQRDPSGMSRDERLAVVRRAVRLTRTDDDQVAGAVPVIPGIAESGAPEVALTYLFLAPDEDVFEQADRANALAAEIGRAEPDMMVRATGTTVAQAEQAELVEDRLRWVEIGTGILVFLIVGLHFRTLAAPLMTLAAVLVAYVLSDALLAEVGPTLDVTVPREVQPVMVVLVFGVVTDYSIFYLSRARARLAEGDDRLQAARDAAASLTGIISVAALSVAAAAATLLLADLEFLSAFGPGMAVAVVVAALTAMTLGPALMAIGGRRLLREGSTAAGERERPRLRGWTTRFAARFSRTTVVLTVVLLAGGATGLWFTEMSNPVIRGLPSGSGPHEGYDAAAAATAPGAVAPTMVVVRGEGLADRRPALDRLGELLSGQPGVARVLGANEVPGQSPLGLAISRDGDAARYVLVLSGDPLGANAIDTAGALERRLPSLLEDAGLPRAQAALAGDTALAADTIDGTLADLAVVTPAAIAAVFLVLALYLRALAAPLAIVAASTLGLAATLGIATWFFQVGLGQDGLVFYVPFATAVLLLSLGADYSVFLAGRVWRAAERRTLRDAVRVAGTQAAGPITTAAFVLAASFALLAVVPVQAFHQVAFTMAAGLLIDGFVVRTLLVPALLAMGAREPASPDPV